MLPVGLIVKDKSELDWTVEKTKIQTWMDLSFYELSGERNYKPLKGRVVIEELIKGPSGDLKDYKFFYFHGDPKYIQVDGDRHSHHKRDIYDIYWNRLNVKYEYNNFDEPVEKPILLMELADTARNFLVVFLLSEWIYIAQVTKFILEK